MELILLVMCELQFMQYCEHGVVYAVTDISDVSTSDRHKKQRTYFAFHSSFSPNSCLSASLELWA